MDIVADNIIELDLYVIINLSRELSKTEAKNIEDASEAWCKVALSGAFDGPLHNFTQPEYDTKKGCVVFQIDAGSMNPVEGFELLKNICDGLNKYIFGEEVVSHIELSSCYEEE